MKLTKILRPAMSLILCIAAIVICLNAAAGFDTATANPDRIPLVLSSEPEYINSSYEYYGGDAYTGIQHAGADAANNVAILGDNIESAAFVIYDNVRVTGNNVAELAAPVNAVTASVAAIGSMLSTAMALGFAIPAVKNLFDLIEAVAGNKKTAAPVAE